MRKSRYAIRELLDPLDIIVRAVRFRHAKRLRQVREKIHRWNGTKQANYMRQLARKVGL
jgi:hypothetical protein